MKAMTSIFCALAVVFGLSIPACAKLVDMRDGTVYDTDTQLSWQKDAAAGGLKTWDEAVAWAASLNEKGGFAHLTGWRLPARSCLRRQFKLRRRRDGASVLL